MKIDINADLGESFGPYQMGDDERLMKVITSANIACGFHAGDFMTIPETIHLAKENEVQIGAHPGYQDLLGFGRRVIDMKPKEIYHMMIYQVGAIDGFAKVSDWPLHHVKPHGALYNQAAKDSAVAEAIAEAIYDYNGELLLYGLANSELLKAGKKVGLNVASEAFADRTYTREGFLSPRSESNSVLTKREHIQQQVLDIVTKGQVSTVDGSVINLYADTICFHGDGEDVVNQVNEVKNYLKEQGISIKSI
ncbi:LamB/YcsF family protein [Halalkalibacillus halophilus]|uniref:LamB/YcsF family protein n=1 Tax=Halalkalibacillus halophilus TaxID=392827 RepID=UPI000406E390|nr:5-oxoprolinase subunit PxpA [Halalkalibacillus halophilus]